MSATTLPTPAAAVPPAGPAAEAPGLRGAFRLLLSHLGDHLELLRLETGQELARFGKVLGCWFALALLMQLGLMMGLGLLLAASWHGEYRVHAIIASAVTLMLALAYCIWQLRQLGRRAASRFSHSGQQWKRDLDLIRELV